MMKFAQTSLGILCPLAESMNSVVYAGEQRSAEIRMHRLHADLNLRCPQIAQLRNLSCAARL